MVPIIGLVRVLRAAIVSGHETADWMDTDEGRESMMAAYTENAGSDLVPDEQTD